MGDTELIKRAMNVREIREWINFAFTVLILPIGYVAGHSFAMDIKADVAKEYVTKENYNALLNQVGVIQGKLESLQMAQIHDADTLALIKEQLSYRRAP